MQELTIITPTYNREKTLPAVYESLCRQTNKNFVWLVVDDGSTDNTEKLINEYMNSSDFDIQYYKKENGGKARAINYALDILDTKYSVCLDSDDTFSEEAVEKALTLLHEEDDNETCCGVMGLRHSPNGCVMGGKEIPRTYKYITIIDIYYSCKIRSEFITFYKSDIAKQYRFPEIEGEKFIPPSWFHYTLCENYSFRTTWEKICYCEYIGDGLTKNKGAVIVKNPIGYTLIKRLSFRYARGFKHKIKNAIMYDCGCIICKDKEWLEKAPNKTLAILSFPLAVAVYIKRFRTIYKNK